jgi:heat-inducible transcriptional repressor
MTQLTVAELTDRAREVFRLIVDGYLATGQPVGSRTISRIGTLGLSPASIRNVMQDLEELGLLAAPHTSAGRMPTELGLRLFVDGLMQVQDLSAEEQAALSASARAEGAIETVLDRASAALAELSHCAGVVLVPRAEPIVRQFSFVPLSPERALVVLVGEDGSVENRLISLPPGVPPAAFIEAANFATARAAGRTLGQAMVELRSEIAAERAELDALARDVIERGLAVWSTDAQSRSVMIVRGQAHLLDDAKADIERVRQLLEDIEDKEALVRLLDLAREAQAMKLFIGSETNLFSLSGSAVIAAPWRAGGRLMGVVGVIGPTRLNYARVVPMVEFTANALSQRTA